VHRSISELWRDERGAILGNHRQSFLRNEGVIVDWSATNAATNLDHAEAPECDLGHTQVTFAWPPT